MNDAVWARVRAGMPNQSPEKFGFQIFVLALEALSGEPGVTPAILHAAQTALSAVETTERLNDAVVRAEIEQRNAKTPEQRYQAALARLSNRATEYGLTDPDNDMANLEVVLEGSETRKRSPIWSDGKLSMISAITDEVRAAFNNLLRQTLPAE